MKLLKYTNQNLYKQNIRGEKNRTERTFEKNNHFYVPALSIKKNSLKLIFTKNIISSMFFDFFLNFSRTKKLSTLLNTPETPCRFPNFFNALLEVVASSARASALASEP